MKKILSLSKMREVMPLPPSKEGVAREAVFLNGSNNGKVTELSDADFNFLFNQPDSVFKFLLDEGTFSVVFNDKEDAEKPKLSKKEQKKLNDEQAKKDKKMAEEIKKARQGK